MDAAGVPSAWSTRRVFEIVYPPVIINEGTGSTNDSTPLLKWQSLASVSGYEVIIQRSGDRKMVFRAVNIGTDSLEIPTALPAGTYSVWVREWMNGRAVSAWGPGTSLTVQAPPQISYSNQRLNWSPIPESVSYDICVSSLLTGQVVVSRIGVTTAGLAISPPLVPGRYRIEAQSNYLNDQHSDLRTTEFEVFHPPVVLKSLPASTMDQTLVIQWQPVAGAASFDIVVQRTSDHSLVYHQSGLTGTQHRIATPLPNGQMSIWMRANFSNQSRSSWGAGDDVTIGSAPGLSVVGNSLTWIAVPDATTYEIWVNARKNGQTTWTAFVRTDLHVGTSFQLTTLESGTQYRAWIRAERAEAGSLYRGQWSSAIDFGASIPVLISVSV